MALSPLSQPPELGVEIRSMAAAAAAPTTCAGGVSGAEGAGKAHVNQDRCIFCPMTGNVVGEVESWHSWHCRNAVSPFMCFHHRVRSNSGRALGDELLEEAPPR